MSYMPIDPQAFQRVLQTVLRAVVEGIGGALEADGASAKRITKAKEGARDAMEIAFGLRPGPELPPAPRPEPVVEPEPPPQWGWVAAVRDGAGYRVLQRRGPVPPNAVLGEHSFSPEEAHIRYIDAAEVVYTAEAIDERTEPLWISVVQLGSDDFRVVTFAEPVPPDADTGRHISSHSEAIERLRVASADILDAIGL